MSDETSDHLSKIFQSYPRATGKTLLKESQIYIVFRDLDAFALHRKFDWLTSQKAFFDAVKVPKKPLN